MQNKINMRMEKLCYVHFNCLIKIIARDNLVVAVVWQLEMNKLLFFLSDSEYSGVKPVCMSGLVAQR